jgi:hypothetical protein
MQDWMEFEAHTCLTGSYMYCCKKGILNAVENFYNDTAISPYPGWILKLMKQH